MGMCTPKVGKETNKQQQQQKKEQNKKQQQQQQQKSAYGDNLMNFIFSILNLMEMLLVVYCKR